LSLQTEVELVIVGGGGAGLPAAVQALENGVSSLVILEKRSRLGGNAEMAWGLFAAQSPVQKEGLVDARKEVLFKSIMDWAHWKISPEIFRAFIWKSGDTIKWLEDMGLKFNLVRYFPGQEPPVWHIPDGHGARLVEVLAKRCDDLGGQVLLNTRCKQILSDEKGILNGVLAEKDGKEFIIKTKSVIIATGGYAGNRELLQKYCEYYDDHVHCFGLPHTGDGLRMAADLGASTASLGLLLLEWPHVYGDGSASLESIAREPYTVYVNKTGKRFIDEIKGFHAFECANAVLRQPDKIGYILADEEMINRAENSGVRLGRGRNRAERRRKMPGLKEQVHTIAALNSGNICISDSWDEIALFVGADPSVLKATIDEYNTGCDRGRDDAFFKDPFYLRPLCQAPYYAIKGELVFLNTMGGLKINEFMEVIDTKGSAIKGLYAAGADTGDWEPDTYCDNLSGTAFGFAVNSGRIAAENAVKYISQK
jgi:fumarate reductase flavoprotein subunit